MRPTLNVCSCSAGTHTRVPNTAGNGPRRQESARKPASHGYRSAGTAETGARTARLRWGDPFLTLYYGGEVVTCREYWTANGARLATYQWWVLGFVSGASHVSGKRPMPRLEPPRALELLSKHCEVNKNDTLGTATVAVARQLGAAP
jgi:hypothetical protein